MEASNVRLLFFLIFFFNL